MYGNIVGVGLVGLFLSYLAYNSWKSESSLIPERSGLLVAQDTGKTKHIQSKNGDASMQTELYRRRAIQQSGRLQTSKIKETRTLWGSTTGALETFMITGICPALPCCPPSGILFDGGDENAEYCPVLDDTGTGATLDAGNQNTRVCGL